MAYEFFNEEEEITFIKNLFSAMTTEQVTKVMQKMDESTDEEFKKVVFDRLLKYSTTLTKDHLSALYKYFNALAEEDNYIEYFLKNASKMHRSELKQMLEQLLGNVNSPIPLTWSSMISEAIHLLDEKTRDDLFSKYMDHVNHPSSEDVRIQILENILREPILLKIDRDRYFKEFLDKANSFPQDHKFQFLFISLIKNDGITDEEAEAVWNQISKLMDISDDSVEMAKFASYYLDDLILTDSQMRILISKVINIIKEKSQEGYLDCAVLLERWALLDDERELVLDVLGRELDQEDLILRMHAYSYFLTAKYIMSRQQRIKVLESWKAAVQQNISEHHKISSWRTFIGDSVIPEEAKEELREHY